MASELQGQGAGDRLAVGLDVAKGELRVDAILELGDPALGPAHAPRDFFLGKSRAQPLADEVRDDFGPHAGGADAQGGLRRDDTYLSEVFHVPVAGRAERCG